MEARHKYKVGDKVTILLKSRPFRTVILEKVEGRLFYRVDWTAAGFNSLLNTVAIAEKAIKIER